MPHKRGTVHNMPKSGNSHPQHQLPTHRCKHLHHKPFTALLSYHNSKHTPFQSGNGHPWASGHLGQIIPPFTKNVHSNSILQGTYNLSNIDPMPEIRQFLEAMVRPPALHSTSPVNTTITTLDFQKGFRKLSDKTSSSPSGCHITDYKILATDPDLSQILDRTITMPFTHSFPLPTGVQQYSSCLKKNQANPQYPNLE
jgi:hypothetical protein